MKKNTNYSAFPQTAFDSNGNLKTQDKEFEGLTKREYFAGLAMQGILSSRTGMNASAFKENKSYYSNLSIELADELLKQLEQ
jgi:hypothetical protein